METHLDPRYSQQLHSFRKKLLADLASIELTQLKVGFPHQQVLPKATYAPWLADEDFLEIYKKISSNTLIDIYRLFELHTLIDSLSSKHGDVLEVGVWKGGSAAILGNCCKHFSNCKLWLADTFTGVPTTETGKDSIYRGGEHSDTSVVEVQKLLHNCDVKNYELLVGLFPEETSKPVNEINFRFVHVDVDTYESASKVFRWAWPQLVPGGIVVFDDYGFWGCEGVTAFVNELRDDGFFVIHNLNGHAILLK